MWINQCCETRILGRAVSWFWIAFGVGMTIVAPWFSGFMIPRSGETTTLLVGFVFVLAGSGCALVLNRAQPERESDSKILPALGEGLMVLAREPKMRLAVLVKTINDIGKFSLVILMPVYLPRFGFSIQAWLTIWGLVNVLNIFAGYFFGWLGDTIGWRKTVVFSPARCAAQRRWRCVTPRYCSAIAVWRCLPRWLFTPSGLAHSAH
ncbi:hypothetical protein ACFSKS_05310 [Pseudocitrobacter faecalis]